MFLAKTPGPIGRFVIGEVLPSHSQVISEVVDNNLCAGCGVCAGVCPSKALEMRWRENGDLAPTVQGQCPPQCALCLQVCPFHSCINEDQLAEARFSDFENMNRDAVAGYFLDSFAGYSKVNGHREQGSSGGMATWLMESMLEKGEVDAIVNVGPPMKEDRLFSFGIRESAESLRETASSRYYPVDLSDVIAFMNRKDDEKRYAVVGLPCAIKGLRLAMETMPRLRRRVIYTVGLVCGHMPNRFYTEYLARLSTIFAMGKASR